ncbi:MAG: hypothetical protein O7H41_16285 [Planctomycetota bacterium]|nr:hypothetical protein [Planctomycetota bacterium]
MGRIVSLGLPGVVILALSCIGSPDNSEAASDQARKAPEASDGNGAMLRPLEEAGADGPQNKPKSGSDVKKPADPPKTGKQAPKPASPKDGAKKPAPGADKAKRRPPNKQAPGADEAKRSPRKKPSAKPKGRETPKQALKRYSRDKDILEQARISLSRSHLESGKRKMELLDWVGAEKDFKKAYSLDPTSEEAQELLFTAGRILGKREDTMGSAIKTFRDEQVVRRQQIAIEIRRILAEGKDFYDGTEYEKAILKFQQAEAMLSIDSPYIPDSADLLDKVRAYIGESKRRKNAAELSRNRNLTNQATRAASAEEQRRRDAEEDKVNFLLDLAIENISKNRYKKALDLLDDVLEIDPHNRLAVRLRDGAKEGSFLHKEWTAIRQMNEQLLLSTESVVEAAIPYTDLVRFPPKEKWLEVAKRVEGTGAAFAEEDPEVRRMREILNTRRVTINFDETPLDAVVTFLQDVTGLNMQISPQVDATGVNVSLGLNEAILANALRLILDKVNLSYTFKDQVIYIAEPGEEEGELIFEIYNVQDILNKIEDFTGPEIKVTSADAPQPGGGGAGQLIFDDDDDEDLEGTIDPDKLLDLIQSSTGEDNWEREGVSIEHHRGQLLINNVREIHLEVQEVLENLRKDAGLFVVVEARFIDLFDDFISEFGIDYRGLPNAPIGNPTGVLAPNQSGGTDTGAERTRGTGTDNFIGRIQGIFDGFTGFLTGSRLTGGTLPGRNIPGLSIQTTFIEPFQVNAILRARDEKSRVQLLSAPVITAANRQRVYISAITQRAYIADYDLASGGSGFVAVEVADPIIQTFEEGVILDVRPTISSDRRYVTLDAKPTLAQLVGGFISTILVDLGSINQAAQQVPIGIPEITLQEAYTSVTVPDGGTALLGGFRSLNEQKLRSSIPILESIPIFNILGTRTGELSEKRSLIILITARVVVVRDQEKALFSTQ